MNFSPYIVKLKTLLIGYAKYPFTQLRTCLTLKIGILYINIRIPLIEAIFPKRGGGG